MEVILLPEKIGVVIFGRVVNLIETDNNKVIAAIEFEHIRPEDQELMIKHNLNKQMCELREKNDYN